MQLHNTFRIFPWQREPRVKTLHFPLTTQVKWSLTPHFISKMNENEIKNLDVYDHSCEVLVDVIISEERKCLKESY